MDSVELLMSRFSELDFIFDKRMPEKQKGLYIDNTIYLNPSQSKRELLGTISEEIGHHFTSSGDITDQNSIETTKQECKARLVGSELTVHPDKLIECKRQGFSYDWQCAEYLDVTVEHFRQALKLYKDKYGLYFEYESYLFVFREADTLDIRYIN